LPFNSPGFVFVFLPLSLAAFYGAGLIGRRAQLFALAGSALIFYGWSDPALLWLLGGSVLGNYLVGRLVDRTTARSGLQSAVLALGVGANTALLAYYKYATALFHIIPALQAFAPAAGHALPLALSFFTITQIMYLLDCQQQRAHEPDLLRYSLFATFFPSLISGPILHHRELMPQLSSAAAQRPKPDDLAAGVTMFVLGLGKKALLADPIAPYADAGYAHPATLPLFAAWGAALAFSLQLYFDFSGYCDMAMGIARMFGIRLPLNFASPYKARNIIEFWQRWNMTLTRFLSLYIYNPLALWIVRHRAARSGATLRKAGVTPLGFLSSVALPTTVTMSIMGIWHGAGWQFLCFGLLHAIFIIATHAWRSLGPRRGAKGGGGRELAGSVLAVFATFLAVVVAQTFFRAASIGDALAIQAGLFGLHGLDAVLWNLPSTEGGTGAAGWAQIAALLAITWLAPNTQQIMAEIKPSLDPVRPPRPGVLQWRPTLPWAIGVGLIFIVSLEGIGRSRSFLYFQF